jgi:hypothetical protein
MGQLWTSMINGQWRAYRIWARTIFLPPLGAAAGFRFNILDVRQQTLLIGR